MTDRSLPRRLVVLLATSCALAVASIYYAQPLLHDIAASLGVAEGTVGLVVTLTQAGYAVGLLLLVPLGDVLDPRRLIVAHLAASALALGAVGAAPSVSALLLAFVGVGALAVVVQTTVAYAASLTDDHQRGAVVGTLTSGVVIGILGSRVLAGGVAELVGWRAVYLGAAALALLTALLLWRALPAPRSPPVPQRYRDLIASVATLYRGEPLLRRRAGLALLVFGAFSTLWTALALPLSAAPWSLTSAEIGAFGLAGLAGALAASRAGRLADRGHGVATTGVALAALAAAWAPIALLDRSLLWLVLGVIVLDFAVQAVHVTSQTLLYSARPEARSRMAGAYMLCYSIGSAGGAAASTALYAAAGWTAVCVLGAGLSVAALLHWARFAAAERRAAPLARATVAGATCGGR